MWTTSPLLGLLAAATATSALALSEDHHQANSYNHLFGRDTTTSTTTTSSSSSSTTPTTTSSLSSLSTTTTTTSVFDPLATTNVAAYFGRAQGTSTPSLYSLCTNTNIDIIIIGFIRQFNGKNVLPSFAFTSSCKTPSVVASNTTVSCPDLAQNVSFCQQQGKKVLISLGGSSSNVSLGSVDEANQAASSLWNFFGAGLGGYGRPFGDVSVDGFDFDLESGADTDYTDTLASSLQSLFSTSDTEGYIGVSPLCANNTVLPRNLYANANFVWPRFYNAQACCVGSKGFNSSVLAWSNYVSGIASNVTSFNSSHPKFYIGALSFDNGNSGFVAPDAFEDAVVGVREEIGDKLSGVSVWEGTDALVTVDAEGRDFLNVTKAALEVEVEEVTSEGCDD